MNYEEQELINYRIDRIFKLPYIYNDIDFFSSIPSYHPEIILLYNIKDIIFFYETASNHENITQS